MLNSLRKKFVFGVMAIFLVVVLIIFGAVNLLNLYQINSRYDSMLSLIAENDGLFPEVNEQKEIKISLGLGYNLTQESRFENRYFSADVDEDGNITNINVDHVAVESDEAKDIVDNVLSLGIGSGTYDRFRYLVDETTPNEADATGIVERVFMIDMSQGLQSYRSIMSLSGIIAAFMLVLVLVIAILFSKPAMMPVIRSMEQQKRFITDASHEIKTPLAIISANADVLEIMNGKNEWTDSIKKQTVQMDNLIKQLLFIDQLDEGKAKESYVDFNLSENVSDKVAQFVTLAQSRDRGIVTDIESDIMMNGDPQAITQLVSILVENATKYAKEGSNIEVNLKHVDDKKHGVSNILEVINEADNIESEELDKLFRRFYRTDKSRTRKTGGFGIGLSIAKSIVESHGGKIEAVSLENERVCFRATFKALSK